MNTTRLAPRGGTIFWGTVLLLAATITGISAALGTWDGTTAVWIVIAFGALMVIAGLIGGISRAVTRDTEPTATADRPITDADGVDLT